MSKNLNQMNKSELVDLLINEYGYEKEDLKGKDGKPFTNGILKSMIIDEQRDEEALNHKESAISVEKDFQVEDTDLILVMNGTQGEFIHRSTQTGRMWKFTRYGQTDRLPFIEIMSIYNVNPRCLESGSLIVLNDKVTKMFNLESVKSGFIQDKDMEDIILNKSAEEIEDIIVSIPESTKGSFFNKARELYNQGRIDSISVVDAIEKLFKVSLRDNAPLGDIVN